MFILTPTQLISLELELDPLHQAVEQQDGLAPGGVQLVPVHGDAGQTTQPEAIDGAEVSRVPDVESGVEDVCFLEFVQLGLIVAELAVQRAVLVLRQQELLLVETVLAPVLLLLLLQSGPAQALGLQLRVDLLILLLECLQLLDQLLLLQLQAVQLHLELAEVAAVLRLVTEAGEELLVLLAVQLRLVELLVQVLQHGVRALLAQRVVHAAVVAQHVEQRGRHLQSLRHRAGLAALPHQGEAVTIAG